MSVRQSDRKLIIAADEAKLDLERVPLEGHSQALMDLALVLFGEVATEMQQVVDRVADEGVEASNARKQLEQTEAAADTGFGDIYDVLWMTHRHQRLGSDDRSASHMGEVQRYLEGNNPSDFQARARAAKVAIMGKALSYIDQFTADGLVPQEVIDNAVQSHQEFNDAYDAWRAEGADVTDARNIADTVRPSSRAKFTSARETAASALRLSGVDRPISDYCPSLSEIDAGNYTPSDDNQPTPSDDIDQPVEA